jgi:hypothetical protein
MGHQRRPDRPSALDCSDRIDTVDARGKLVVPGLLDIHCHAARIKDVLLNASPMASPASSMPVHKARSHPETMVIAKSVPQPCRVLINIGRAGILPDGDDGRQPGGHRRRARRDCKRTGHDRRRQARLSRRRRRQRFRGGCSRSRHRSTLPVMIHGSDHVASRVLELSAGDIVTHLYAPLPSSIVDDNGQLLPRCWPRAAASGSTWGTAGPVTSMDIVAR